MVPVGERGVSGRLPHDDLAAHEPPDGLSVRRGGRGEEAHEAFPERRIELPSEPQQRESLAQEEAVAHVGQAHRIEAPLGPVEVSQHALAAAVGDLVDHGAVAARDLLGLDQEEVRRELHSAPGVARGQVDVRDDPVGGVGGVDGEIDRAGDPLEGARQPPPGPAGDVGARIDLDPHHLRPALRCPHERQHREPRRPDESCPLGFHCRCPCRRIARRLRGLHCDRLGQTLLT